MIKVIVAELNHFEGLKLKRVYDHTDALEYGKLACDGINPVFSIVDASGKIIGIFGGVKIFPWCLECFGLFSDDIEKYKKSFHKIFMYFVENSFTLFNVTRLQLVVCKGYSKGKNWVVALGFKFEGILRGYGQNGDDYVIYGKVV